MDNARVHNITVKIGFQLREPLPTAVTDLKASLTALESLRTELLECRVDQQRLVYEKRYQMLHPKDKDLTELDRRTMLNASLASLERDLDFLVGLEELAAQRQVLGLALLDSARVR